MHYNTKIASLVACFFLGIALNQSDNILICIQRIILYTQAHSANTDPPPIVDEQPPSSLRDDTPPIRSYGFRLSVNGKHIVPVAARPHLHQPANHQQLTDEQIFDMLAKSTSTGDRQGDADDERCQQDPRCAVTLLNRNDPRADYDRIANMRPIALAPLHQSIAKLRCGRSLLATPYDDLFIRLDRRCRQPFARRPDPSAAYMFVRSTAADMRRLRPKRLAARLRRHLQHQNNRQRSHWMGVHSMYLLGNYWRMLGKPLHAMQCFQTALVVRPKHVGLLYSTAQLLLHLGRTRDAELLVQAALAAATQRPRSWQHWHTMGEISRRLNGTQALRNCAHRAILLHPRHALVWRLQGAVATQRLASFGDSCLLLLNSALFLLAISALYTMGMVGSINIRL